MALTYPTTPFLNFQSKPSETQDETPETFNETNAPSLLINFPSFVCSDLAWPAAQFKNEEQYVYYLSAEEKFEIDAALQSFQGVYTSNDSSRNPSSNLKIRTRS
jgi:hypothetical protein